MDQYLLSVFTVFSFEKTTTRWGKKPLKRTKKEEKKPSTKPTMDFVSFDVFFFLLVFFFFCQLQEDEMPSAPRILVPLCFSLPTPSVCQRLPSHRATCARRQALPQLTLTPAGRGTSQPRGSSCAIRRWPEELGERFDGLVGRQQVPPDVLEPQTTGNTHSPHPEMMVADFLCGLFPVSPLEKGVFGSLFAFPRRP